jgi:hypothetical protein
MPTTYPPGSYVNTSREITFDGGLNTAGVLSAQCQKVDGSWVKSALQYDVGNMDGTLMPLPSGSYQLSSRNIHLENGSDGVYLVAECKKINGSWVTSKLKLPDIANIDGTLKVS